MFLLENHAASKTVILTVVRCGCHCSCRCRQPGCPLIVLGIVAGVIVKMSSNSVMKNSIVIGGLTLLGYVAGGKLGSMFGAVIGTVVCSLFNSEEPMRQQQSHHPRFDDNETHLPLHRNHPYYPPRQHKNGSRQSKSTKPKDKSCEPSKCSICLESFKPSILLLPCSHMCFCDNCYDSVKRKNVSICPICRFPIEEVMFVYPS